MPAPNGIDAAVRAICEHANDRGALCPPAHVLHALIAAHCISRGRIDPVWTGNDLADMYEQAIEERNTATAEVRRLVALGHDEEPVTEMRLCEVPRVMLRPNQLYRFTVDPNCPACQKAAAPYRAD